jgi:hypothetical protein
MYKCCETGEKKRGPERRTGDENVDRRAVFGYDTGRTAGGKPSEKIFSKKFLRNSCRQRDLLRIKRREQ